MAGNVVAGQDEAAALEHDAVRVFAVNREAACDAARLGDAFAKADGVLETNRELVCELLAVLPEILEGVELVNVAGSASGPKRTTRSPPMSPSSVLISYGWSLHGFK